MIKPDVPFIPNPGDECVVCCVGMVLGYFLPEKQFTPDELKNLCDYQEGHGCWEFPHLFAMDDMGFELRRIDDFDLKRFAEDAEAYLREILKDNPDALEYQLSHAGDLKKHEAEAKEYLRRGLHHEQRIGTRKDIEDFIKDGWLVRLEVNANTLRGIPGNVGHSVLVIGLDGDGVIIHNPDNKMGNKPAQHVAWPLLIQAWKEFGGSYSIYAYRYGDKK